MSDYSGFQIDELHHHNQNLVGTLHATSLLWSTNMKTAVTGRGRSVRDKKPLWMQA